MDESVYICPSKKWRVAKPLIHLERILFKSSFVSVFWLP